MDNTSTAERIKRRSCAAQTSGCLHFGTFSAGCLCEESSRLNSQRASEAFRNWCRRRIGATSNDLRYFVNGRMPGRCSLYGVSQEAAADGIQWLMPSSEPRWILPLIPVQTDVFKNCSVSKQASFDLNARVVRHENILGMGVSGVYSCSSKKTMIILPVMHGCLSLSCDQLPCRGKRRCSGVFCNIF